MDREQYLWEGYRQLYNTKYYFKWSKPIYIDTVSIINNKINILWNKKYINTQRNLLGSTEPKPRLFYVLPKSQKNGVDHI